MNLAKEFGPSVDVQIYYSISNIEQKFTISLDKISAANSDIRSIDAAEIISAQG